MPFNSQLSPSDYFQWLLGFFKIFGLYPSNQGKRRIIYLIFSVPHIIVTMLSVILDLLNVVLNQETFQRKMLSIGVLSMHTAAGLRILSWFWTKDKFEQVITVIQRPGFEFRNFESRECRKIDSRKRFARFVQAFKNSTLRKTNAICCSIYLIVSAYIFLNFLSTYGSYYFKETYEKFNPDTKKTSTYRDFPYPMWFPFDTSVSDGYYTLALFYQLYAYFNLMASFWCVDWLILSSIIHLQYQLIVVSFAMTKVDKNIPKMSRNQGTYLIKRIRLVKCVEELNEIYRAANLIEVLCNKQLLIQNGLATFILCTLLYVATTLTVPLEISYISAATGIILLEPFTQCWICQNFTMEFSKVLEKVYELDWINYPADMRKFLVLTMARLQKPAVFTLGKWITMDISFYLQLLKITYSFYTLISRQNRNNK